MDPEKEVFALVQNGDVVALRDLLRAHPEAARAHGPDGMSVLQFAAYARRLEAIRVLCEHDALQTLHEAAILGDTDGVDRLCRAHPERLDAPGPDGFRPLHLAAHFAQHDALERLLEHGADLHARSTNETRNTALHAAAAGAAVATLRILLASGSDPDARDAAGNTALHVAAAAGAAPCIEALLAGGVDPMLRNEDDQTALDLARGRDKDEAVRLLETVGSTRDDAERSEA